MQRSQAEAIVAMVQAFFPRPELPPTTVLMWADELEGYDFADAQEAARRLARSSTYPVLADLLDRMAEVRSERERLELPDRPALPSPAEFEAIAPPDVVEKFRALREKWAKDVAPLSEEEIERRRKLRPAAGPKVRMILVGPTAVCDRCSHQQRRHAGPSDEVWKRKLSSDCLVPGCVCDGFFPQRAA